MAKASNAEAGEAEVPGTDNGSSTAGRRVNRVRGEGKQRKPRRRKSNPDNIARRARETSRVFPAATFSSALALAEAIQQHSAGQPIRRLTLFEKLNRSPESGPSRMMITNSNRYGLTTGGYQADVLELTDLGKVATSPETQPRERLAARFKLAIEGIPAFKLLYEKNKGQRVPPPEVLRDMLAAADVPEAYRKECVEVFLENLKFLGLLRTVAGAERIIPIEQALEEAPGTAVLPRGRPSPLRVRSSWGLRRRHRRRVVIGKPLVSSLHQSVPTEARSGSIPTWFWRR